MGLGKTEEKLSKMKANKAIGLIDKISARILRDPAQVIIPSSGLH